MERIKNQLKLLSADIFLAVLFASCISYALTTTLATNTSYFDILILTTIACFFYIFLFKNLITFFASISSVSLLLIIYLLFIDKSNLTYRTIDYIQDLINRVYLYILDDGNILGIEFTLAAIISFFVTFIVFFMLIKLNAYYFTILLGGALFASQSILGYIKGYTAFYLYVIALVLIYVYDIHYRKYKKLELKDRPNAIFIASTIPIILIIFITTLFMRFSNEPLELPWIDNKVVQFYNYVINTYQDYKGENDFFSFNNSGFIQNDKLGGPAVLETIDVLKVYGTKSTYLKAVGKDTYTGSQWKDTFTERKSVLDPDGFIAEDIYEMNFGLKLLSKYGYYKYKDFFQENKYQVNFLDIRKTKSIFIPKGFDSINLKNVKFTSNYNLSTSIDSMKGRGFQYEVTAQIPDHKSKALINALLNSYDGLYKNYKLTKPNTDWKWDDIDYPFPDKDIKLDYYAERADKIRAIYTALPKNIPARVKDLAFQITKDETTNYGKAKALETYLSSSFPYTLQPSITPKNQDFVDYFLFVQKKGLCVHFASSMAVMARVVGLPARYVEGYMMPQKQNIDGSYTLTNHNAHAWVEIYFEGAGWVPFEATASFYSDFYKQEEATPTDIGEITFQDDEQNTMPERIRPEEDLGDTGIAILEYNPVMDFIKKAFIGIVIVIIIITSITVINIERRRYRIRKMKSLPPSQAMVKLYGELLRIMAKLGYRIIDNETAIQYGKRIDGLFYIRPVSFEEISNTFTEARYAGRPIDASKIQSFDIIYSNIINLYIKEKGKLRYIIAYYLLGTI